MTETGKSRWPTRSVIACALLLPAAVGALAVAGTMTALAQQGWEPTVSTGPAPAKVPVVPSVRTAGPKIKSAPLPVAAVETVLEPRTMADDRKSAVSQTRPRSTASLETGSIAGARPDEYCANIANPAADARFAWQKKTLADMEQEITKRIALLEEKTAEYQKWLARRDEF